MEDHGDGIRLNRTIELPFPPAAKIAVYSKDWEGIEEIISGGPLGYRLKEITWDVDRNCFLAEKHSSMSGTPIAMIPHEIRMLLDRRWNNGSYQESYKAGDRRGRKRSKLPTMHISDWDEEEAAGWEAMPKKHRPKEFKTILHAIITTMAELRNNCSVAYAMMKTGDYVDVPEGSVPELLPPLQKKFHAAMREYQKLTFDRQWDWCQSIKRRYPRLSDVVEAME